MIGPRRSKDDEAFADALEGRGSRNSDVEQLVRFAESLCKAAVEPSADFVLDLRAELLADAATVLVVTHKPARVEASQPVAHRVRKRVAAATAGVLATAGLVGIVASSAQSVPGEMLYPVKRGVESIELVIHRSDADRGSFQLSQATERLGEAQALAAQGDSRHDDLVIRSLSDFTDAASSGSQSLFSDYSNGGGNASIDKVNTFATASSATLSNLFLDIPPPTSDAYKTAASTVIDLASRGSALCHSCTRAELTSLAVAPFGQFAGGKSSGTEQTVTTKSQQSTSATRGAGTPAVPLPDVSLPTVPLPTMPTATAKITDGTKPLVGALIGDEDQDAGDPGLLGSLLGNWRVAFLGVADRSEKRVAAVDQ